MVNFNKIMIWNYYSFQKAKLMNLNIQKNYATEQFIIKAKI